MEQNNEVKEQTFKKVGHAYIATHYLDEYNSLVFKTQDEAIFYCTKIDTNFRWVERPLYERNDKS